jgi:hypothetical protein
MSGLGLSPVVGCEGRAGAGRIRRMAGALQVVTHVLVAIVVALLSLQAVLAVLRRERIRQLARAGPAQRIRFYRRLIGQSWALATIVPLICLASDELSAAGLGWAGPRLDGGDDGNIAGWTLAVAWLIALPVGGLLRRLRMGRGDPSPLRPDSPLVPRTKEERRPAAAAAVTAGIVEEVVFRGLLIAVGTQLYHLPLAVVVVASLALFVSGHAYQGLRGMIGVSLAGAVFTTIFVTTGSLLLAVAAHVGQNLVALLVIPANVTPPPTPDGTRPAPPRPPAPSEPMRPPAPTARTLRSAVPGDAGDV